MSLLWTQAMAWMDDNPRDPVDVSAGRSGVPYSERRPGYVKQIAQAHGVSEDAAHSALSAVEDHLAANPPSESGYQQPMHVSHVGFASSPKPGELWGEAHRHKYDNPFMTGKYRDVPLDQIHAGQHGVNPHLVLHNLFHPGSYSPPNAGDPDIKPSGENEDGHSETATHATVRRLEDGSLHAQDGHHRLAADMLLGKKTTQVALFDHTKRRGLFRGRPPLGAS